MNLCWSRSLTAARCFILFAATAVTLSARAQVNFEPYNVTTYAGVPITSGSFDGVGAPTYFAGDTGVAIDSNGTIYVADRGRHVIRKVSANGAITTFAGALDQPGSSDGSAKVARFRFPADLAVDAASNLYVADQGNHTIRKITPAGFVSTIAGRAGVAGASDGQGSLGHFDGPTGVAVGPGGDVYVADTNNHTIRRLSPQYFVTTIAGLPGVAGSSDGVGASARFRNPAGVAVDPAGDVYVADAWNFTIRKITSGNQVSTPLGMAGASGTTDGIGNSARFTVPVGLTFDAAGNLYITDSYNHTVRKVAPGNVVSTIAGTGGVRGDADGSGTAARFNYPYALRCLGETLYVADSSNNNLRAVSLSGVVTTVAGPKGFFRDPAGVAMDSAGNLFVADQQNHTIRKITPAGVVSTFAGAPGQSGNVNGVGSAARFSYPQGVGVDSADNVYVADYYNGLVRKITPGGMVTTLPGTFGWVAAVVIDPTGNVYVADWSASVIRKISTSGAVTIVAGTANLSGCTDGPIGTGRLGGPAGLALDPSGNLYVADKSNHVVRKVTPDGVVTTIIGQCGAPGGVDGIGTAARLDSPTGLALDADGNLFIAEESRIRRMKPDGTVTSLAGPVNTFGSREGRGVDALFYRPGAIAVGPTGSLYLADKNNQVIRRADPYTAVSRKVHGSSVFDLDLPLAAPPAIESRSGGMASAYQVVLSGYAPVTISSARVASGSGTVSGISGSGTSTIVLDLTGVSTGQTLGLTARVNDGVSTRDITVPMSVLVGDANGDGLVNSGDVLLTRSNSGKAADVTNFEADLNGDGYINSSDALIARGQSGTSLP